MIGGGKTGKHSTDAGKQLGKQKRAAWKHNKSPPSMSAQRAVFRCFPTSISVFLLFSYLKRLRSGREWIRWSRLWVWIGRINIIRNSMHRSTPLLSPWRYNDRKVNIFRFRVLWNIYALAIVQHRFCFPSFSFTLWIANTYSCSCYYEC